MPSLTQKMQLVRQLDLTPQQLTKLQNRVQEYAKLKAQMDALKDEMELKKADIEDLREIAGEKTIELPGYGTVSLVEGVTTSLDKTKLLASGVTLAQYDGAMVTKPKKAYILVTPSAGE